MAKVQETNTSPQIKLFGAKISLQETTILNNDNENPTKSDHLLPDKKPDKIIPCPRCKSIDTKFCYFNNYNVNQPRHFCKGCQRYWTAGGALRNVPVGAGRRKNKPPSPELSEGCLFDASGVQRLDIDTVVEEWEEAEHGGITHLSPAKRRRCDSNSQSC